jgi:prepilin-type N-terminal cleavage/methylation domain-containing protein
MTRRGFTLLELMVGLLVSAVAIAIVARSFGMVSATADALARRREESTRHSNARRWLSEALGSVEAGTDSTGVFDGRPDRLHCSTWIMGPGGWPERTTLDLWLDRGVLRGTTHLGGVVLANSVVGVTFDYLLEPGKESSWVQRWESPVSTPFGIRIRTLRRSSTAGSGDRTQNRDVDTLLVLIGGRG